MSWDKLAWRPAGADEPPGVGPILGDLELLVSAIEEAVSGLLMAPITVTGLDLADLASAADLPEGFLGIGTFEPVGHEPCAVAVALDPESASQLAGTIFDPGELGATLLAAIDDAITAIAGEGLQAAASPDATLPADEPLVVLRLALTDPEGSVARLAAAMVKDAPAYVGTHVPTVKALSQSTLDRPAARPAPAPAPVATAGPPADARPTTAPAGVSAGAGAAATPAGEPAPAGPGAMPGFPAGLGGYPGGMPGYPGAMPGYPAGLPGFGAPAPGGYPANVRPLSLDDLAGPGTSGSGGSIDLLYGVNLEVTVEIGRTRLPIRDVLALTPGSIVELDKLAGEKVDVLVNGHLIASGEVVVVEENFGVRITDVSARARRLAMGEGAA